MASSSDAFRMLGNWKKSKTVLKVTVLTKGGIPETLRGLIMAVDEEAMLVTFASLPSRGMGNLDLRGTEFTLGKRSLTAARSPEEILSFVDTGERYNLDAP